MDRVPGPLERFLVLLAVVLVSWAVVLVVLGLLVWLTGLVASG